MSIFLISPKVEPKVDTEEPVKESQEATEPKKEGEVVPEVGLVPQKEINENTIVLDGPLSQVYTQALNQAYSKEGYITTELPAIIDAETDDEHQKTNYLYVTEPSDLEGKGEDQAITSLVEASDKCDNLYVCVEHQFNITPKVASFLNFARYKGATIIHTRERTLEMISSKIFHTP
ncbi:MAG TPA: hypothetical protein VN843_14110 [Anaerolineales bacterium]|nr:hypothetical protein [Anaerolineales bacterium]